VVYVRRRRRVEPGEFLTKKTTFTTDCKKKTTCKKNVKKDPLLVAACLAN
jgi:hypothetical protein